MSSALRFLLTAHPDQVNLVLDGIRSGTLQARPILEQDPFLLHDAIAAMGNNSGLSASLHAAQMELVIHLQSQGASPWRRLASKSAPPHLDAFDHALSSNNALLVAWLAKHPQAPANLDLRVNSFGASPLLHASAPMAQALIDLGFDTQCRDAKGNTPLHLAQTAEQVRVWLAQGLDPTSTNLAGQDVRAAWDKASMVMATRKAMDKALADYVQPDASRVVRDFGRQVVEVGWMRTRQRLSEAGVKPSTARHAGFSLPELLVAEGLRSLLTLGRYSRYDVGKPRTHHRWIKSLMTALKLCGPWDWTATTEPMLDLRASLDLFGLLLQKTAPKPTRSTSLAPAQPAPFQAFQGYLSALPGPQPWPAFSATQNLERRMEILERMTAAGLIDNASLIASYLATDQQFYDPSPTPSEAHHAPRLRLLRMATRGAWDSKWKGPQSLASFGPSPLASLHAPITPYLLKRITQSDVVGVVTVLLAQGFLDTATVELKLRQQILLEGHPFKQHLTLSDPWLSCGIALLAASKTPSQRDLSLRLRAMAEHNDLQSTASPLPENPSVVRRGLRL